MLTLRDKSKMRSARRGVFGRTIPSDCTLTPLKISVEAWVIKRFVKSAKQQVHSIETYFVSETLLSLCINTIMQLFQYFSFQLNGTMKKMKKKPTSENNDAQDAQTFYVLKIFSLRI